MTDNTYLSHCFDVHPFHELNNIDYGMLNQFVQLYLTKNPSAKTSGIFFDVGTNAGSFVKVLLNMGITTNIHCFEPHPVLSRKVKDTYPHVIMNTLCLSNKKGDVVINIPEYSCGISSLIDRPVFDRLKSNGQHIIQHNTTSTTLDLYCEENAIETIDFIKIDVEGAEKMVLEGAYNMLRLNKIKSGIFEIGDTLIDAGTSSAEIVNMLNRLGYIVDPPSISRSDLYFHL